MYKNINILVGSACNMKCGYCLQTNEKSPADHKTDPEEFAEKLSSHLSGSFLKRIAYWGGEPMLYWDKIKTIHSTLKKNNIIPWQSTITTNGRAITEDYIEYVNANPDIFTVISWHDGNFTEEQLKNIFKLKYFSLSFLIHHYFLKTWEVRDLFYDLKNKFDRYPRTCVHFLRANDGCRKDYYMTKEDIDIFCNHLKEIIQLARIGDIWAIWQCRQLLFHRNSVIDRCGPMCVRDELLSVDTHGNTYACHHNYDANNITGNIFKKIIPIMSESLPSPRRFYDSKECQNCEALLECRGGCYTSNTHDLDCYFAKRRFEIYKFMETLHT